MSGSDHVAALINLRTDSMEWKQVALYRVVEDHMTDIWIFEEEPVPGSMNRSAKGESQIASSQPHPGGGHKRT
jgi:hypothetical protein